MINRQVVSFCLAAVLFVGTAGLVASPAQAAAAVPMECDNYDQYKLDRPLQGDDHIHGKYGTPTVGLR